MSKRWWWTGLAGLAALAAGAQAPNNLLKNGSFEEGLAQGGGPAGWGIYGGVGETRRLTLVDTAADGAKAALLADDDPAAEIGLTQVVPAEGAVVYRASVRIRAEGAASSGGSYLQLRFLPSGEYRQRGLAAQAERWREVAITAQAPADTKQIQIYLYSHAGPTPHVLLDDARLISGAEMEEELVVPDPVPPKIETLKDLHLTTELVRAGQPAITIVAPAAHRAAGERIQAAVREITGATVPLVDDADPAAAVPFAGSLVLLGNRNTNRTVSTLYDRYYTLTDLKYPGPGGHELRTLHSPFGDGRNAILVGGSDAGGVDAAAAVLVEKLKAAGGGQGSLAVGRLMEVKLAPGYTLPDDMATAPVWEASEGYGSVGYFGWTSLSKRLALYYMTGDPSHAREFLRLAFPDAEAKAYITRVDGERVENKDAPLSGFYHYNAHLAMLLWDLVEEGDAFTDEERLRVTNAFAQQLNHRKDEGVYPLLDVPPYVGSRHGQYSAVSLFVLGRYFDTHYPHPIWRQALRGSKLHFAPLADSTWLSGEADNLYWYNTALEPLLSYILLSGDRTAIESGSLAKLLRGHEALISGEPADWALRYAALSYLHKAAHLTGDGRWVAYRERTGNDTSVLRLGQSYWPGPDLPPRQPTDLVGVWNIKPVPEGDWAGRGSGLPLEESFQFGSFRSDPGAAGDFILLDGYNGASRNPYHTFGLLELRLGGQKILKASGNGAAYHNQVLTSADGMVEPAVAMDAALRDARVVGDSVVAVGEVPKAAFANWRRTLVQRLGRYALIVDDLTFKRDSANMEAKLTWETGGGVWNAQAQAIRLNPEAGTTPPGWTYVPALSSAVTSEPGGSELVRLTAIKTALVRSTQPGQWIEMAFTLERPFAGEVYAELLNYTDRGFVTFQLDGQPAGERADHWASGAQPLRVPLGRRELAAGEHRLRVVLDALREGSDRGYIGLVGVTLRPDGAGEPTEVRGFDVQTADPLPTTLDAGIPTMTWRGSVTEGSHQRLFSLIAPSGEQPIIARVADNAAALALPEPALAVVGEHQGLNGELVVLAADHLFGLRATQVGTMLSASTPVTVDWHFTSGELAVEAGQPATLILAAAAPGGTVLLDGREATVNEAPDGRVTLELPAGAHRLQRVRPAGADLAPQLAAALAAGREQRAKADGGGAAPPLQAPAWAPAWTAQAPGYTTLAVGAVDGRSVTFLGQGTSVHAYGPDGQALATLEADGPVQKLHWWPEPRLLLVGCRPLVDGKPRAAGRVIAFRPDGQRAWAYDSEQDPEVFRAAKDYWFNTAPGHEGIKGLDSGAFLDGGTQAFVGTACTLEVLSPEGQRLKRRALFWGPGARFLLVDAADGSRDLLVAREPTDGEYLWAVNSRTFDARRAFYGVPAGHSMVPAWAAQTPRHLHYTDLEGDGTKEVVSDINGFWNRVAVWNVDGTPRHNAQFGPGAPIPASNLRGLDVGDLDGDGQQEVVVATAAGLIVVLDPQLGLKGSKRLPSPPADMLVHGSRIVVACEDGSVAVLNAQGEAQALGKVPSRPATLAATPEGVVVATVKGELAGFTLP